MAENPRCWSGCPPGRRRRRRSARSGSPCSAPVLPFFALQAFTAAILVLAANTAFNGFPVLASLLARDGYLPRQLGRRGDRLVFSNGIVLLAALAGAARSSPSTPTSPS